jgi:hypothetical protein
LTNASAYFPFIYWPPFEINIWGEERAHQREKERETGKNYRTHGNISGGGGPSNRLEHLFVFK